MWFQLLKLVFFGSRVVLHLKVVTHDFWNVNRNSKKKQTWITSLFFEGRWIEWNKEWKNTQICTQLFLFQKMGCFQIEPCFGSCWLINVVDTKQQSRSYCWKRKKSSSKWHSICMCNLITFSLRMILFHVAFELFASFKCLITADHAFELAHRRRLVVVHVEC